MRLTEQSHITHVFAEANGDPPPTGGLNNPSQLDGYLDLTVELRWPMAWHIRKKSTPSAAVKQSFQFVSFTVSLLNMDCASVACRGADFLVSSQSSYRLASAGASRHPKSCVRLDR